jgi:hypothetical protein
MARFKDYDRSQGLFLTVNLEEQLLPGTFEWTLDYLIDKMDMSLFEKNYINDETRANYRLTPARNGRENWKICGICLVHDLLRKNGKNGIL